MNKEVMNFLVKLDASIDWSVLDFDKIDMEFPFASIKALLLDKKVFGRAFKYIDEAINFIHKADKTLLLSINAVEKGNRDDITMALANVLCAKEAINTFDAHENAIEVLFSDFKQKHYSNQLGMLNDLHSKGFNIVSCCNCGTILIHEKHEDSTTCPDCLNVVYFEDCADLYS